MPGASTSFTAAEVAVVVLSVVLAVLLALIAWRAWKRSRISPEERERRRCSHLVATGKISDAALVEVQDHVLFYSYAVRGVEYTASQDLSLLGLPAVDLSSVHSVSVKYDPRNPANSIVISTDWNGLHAADLRPSPGDLLNQSPKR
jgi:hypothetical protein